MHDLKMTDQVAWHENDGPSKSRGVKMQEMKMQDLKLEDLEMTNQIA